MNKIVFILLLILTLCSCNKTQDLPQEEPTEFKLKMNDDRYVVEVDKNDDYKDPLYDNYVVLKDVHKIYIEMKEDYVLKSISVLSLDKTITDEEITSILNEVHFDYTLSNDELSIEVDENYVWNSDKKLILYFTVEYNGEHEFRIAIREKNKDYLNRFQILMNEKFHIYEKDTENLIPGLFYENKIILQDYHNLYFEMLDGYELKSISVHEQDLNRPNGFYILDDVNFTYNLTDNKLNVIVDENYSLEDRHILVVYFAINYNGEHSFGIGISNREYFY